MPAPPFVVIDSNILFSALLVAHSTWAEVIMSDAAHAFVICESVLVELFEHKERIVQISKLPADSVVSAFHDLLRPITLYKEDWISPDAWQRAYHLCRNVDEDDTPHVALTIEIDGLLWTGDRRLKAGLQAKGFTRFLFPSQERRHRRDAIHYVSRPCSDNYGRSNTAWIAAWAAATDSATGRSPR